MAKDITFINNYAEQTLDLLVQQFVGKENFTNIITAITPSFQELENVVQSLYLYRNLEEAFGEQLYGLGEVLGLARLGLNDDDYRMALKFQAFLNASKGTPEILISALRIFTNSTDVTLFEMFPAKCYGYFNNESYPIDNKFNNRMDALCMGGVKWLGTMIGNDQPFILDETYSKPDQTGLFGGFAIADANNNIVDDGTCGQFVAFI